MQRLIINVLALLLTLSVFQYACTSQKTAEPFFHGEYQGETFSKLSDHSLVLFNDAIEAEWGMADNPVFIKKVTNKFDEQTVNLADYKPGAKYEVHGDLINENFANGDFHICHKTNGLLNFYVNRSAVIVPGKTISEWSVMGVSPAGQERRAFLYYLERERALISNFFITTAGVI